MAPEWKRIEIAGKPVDLFEPPDALPFALLWLHDESGETPAIANELRAHRLRCVAPIAARSWWVDRVCPEFDPTLTPERHLLDNVVPWIGSRALAVAGIGMGGHGALRLASRHPERFGIVASLAGALDFHEHFGRGTPLDAMYPSREHTRQDTAILHIHGHDWPRHIWFSCGHESEWHRGNDRLHEKLAAIGVPHTAELDATGDVETMLAFVAAALARESRRLA